MKSSILTDLGRFFGKLSFGSFGAQKVDTILKQAKPKRRRRFESDFRWEKTINQQTPRKIEGMQIGEEEEKKHQEKARLLTSRLRRKKKNLRACTQIWISLGRAIFRREKPFFLAGKGQSDCVWVGSSLDTLYCLHWTIHLSPKYLTSRLWTRACIQTRWISSASGWVKNRYMQSANSN